MRRVAQERIEILFNLALETHRAEPALAQRYVDLARRIGARAKVRLPTRFRRLVCRRCKSFIVPGSTLRVRVKPGKPGHVALTCLRCGAVRRIPLRARREQPSATSHGGF
ncbi:MAG: ribonuclease P protein component 4 [Candidatus Bathyarchaeia archaeon]